MVSVIEFIIFLLFNIYVLVYTFSYGIYEFKTNNNKFGGISIIIFAIIVVSLSIFSILNSY